MIPLHPRQKLASARDYNLEPQDHQIYRDAYRGHTFGERINPWILTQLKRTETFNITAQER
jgi:hypothetical protein